MKSRKDAFKFFRSNFAVFVLVRVVFQCTFSIKLVVSVGLNASVDTWLTDRPF